MVTDNDRREWLHHPVTQEFIGLLQGNVQETFEAWGRGVYVGDNPDATAQANAKALGGIAAYRAILEYFDGLKAMENEDAGS